MGTWGHHNAEMGTCGRGDMLVRLGLGGAPDHQCRYPARVVPAGWRHSSYRCCIASLALGALHGWVISLKEEVQWAPHSPDLSPLDFFLWGYLRDRVYKDKPRTSKQLKLALIAEVSAMPSEMVDRAVDHLQTLRMPQVIRRGGGHIEHLL